MSAGGSRTKQFQHRSALVTAAALILIVLGGIGLAYAPFLAGGTTAGTGVLVFVGSISLANIVAGIGLLRLHRWARIAAAALATTAVLLDASTLTGAPGAAQPWISLLANLVVLFAVARRWGDATLPRQGPEGTDLIEQPPG